MNPALITISVFAATTLTCIGAWSALHDVVFRYRQRVNDRLDHEFGGRYAGTARKSALFKNLDLNLAQREAQEPGIWQRYLEMIEQSGLGIDVTTVLGSSAVSALLVGAVTWLLSGHWLGAIAGSALGVTIPTFFVAMQRKKRIDTLRRQLPEAFEIMSRAVRAGQTLSSAMLIVARDLQAPLSLEFKHCCDQQHLGLSQEVTLREMAARTGVLELQMFVVALLVQRQTGGNPTELLNNLSTVVRKRLKMVGKVRALTGEGRMQARVLTLLPIIALGAVWVLNAPYARVLLDRPLILLGLFMSVVVGSLWIRRIVNFDY